MTRVVWPKEDCQKHSRQQAGVMKAIQVVALDASAAVVWMKHPISRMLVVAVSGFDANFVAF